ncbi:MAG: hypothetical protein E6G60_01530 [Actinobacteria bacterium]|nr:MAG: hypothetical protein E6G60_01530 [Actinomycetota bacterium]
MEMIERAPQPVGTKRARRFPRLPRGVVAHLAAESRDRVRGRAHRGIVEPEHPPVVAVQEAEDLERVHRACLPAAAGGEQPREDVERAGDVAGVHCVRQLVTGDSSDATEIRRDVVGIERHAFAERRRQRGDERRHPTGVLAQVAAHGVHRVRP